MAWDTAASIISDALLELGLIKVAVSDPFASTDQNVLQANALLKSLGQELLRDYEWTHLGEEHTFPTVASTDSYALPSDFARYSNGTGWNRTQELPLVGPVDKRQWQALKARSNTGAVSKVFRIWQDEMWLHPTPSTADTIAFEYVSKRWVALTGAASPTKEAPTVNSDELWFDRQVLVTGLKWKHRLAKGQESSGFQADFLRAVTRAQGGDGASPVLSMTGPSPGVDRMLDDANIPDTGYGT
jgi:hypothetical protein